MDRFLQHIRAKPCPRACRTNITGGTYIGAGHFRRRLPPCSTYASVRVCLRAAMPRADAPRDGHKAARRTAAAAARFGPFPGSPGLAGRAFRAYAAPGADPAPARMRDAEFGRSGDAAFGPFSPEVEIPKKFLTPRARRRTCRQLPPNAVNCRTFRSPAQQRRARLGRAPHHWSAGPKAAAGTRPCRPVFERHNSGTWIRAKTNAQGAENGPGREDTFPCTYSSVIIC